MPNSTSKPNTARPNTVRPNTPSYRRIDQPLTDAARQARLALKLGNVPYVSRRELRPPNAMLKRFDSRYWKRLLRYLYIRFVRIRSSPGAIARGMAAGVFAGVFPLIGLQSIMGIAIASLVRGNKVVAVAATFISNPLTSIPIFAFNFHLGRWLLGVPEKDALPSSMADTSAWFEMGLDVFIAMMLGSLIVGLIGSVLGYYVGHAAARRVAVLKAAKQKKQEAKRKQSKYRSQD
jgi:uncharacterized protein